MGAQKMVVVLLASVQDPPKRGANSEAPNEFTIGSAKQTRDRIVVKVWKYIHTVDGCEIHFAPLGIHG